MAVKLEPSPLIKSAKTGCGPTPVNTNTFSESHNLLTNLYPNSTPV